MQSKKAVEGFGTSPPMQRLEFLAFIVWRRVSRWLKLTPPAHAAANPSLRFSDTRASAESRPFLLTLEKMTSFSRCTRDTETACPSACFLLPASRWLNAISAAG